jgi:N-methylhydantoinase A
VEIGGTFTDLVVVDEDGAIAATQKVFSTPTSPDAAVLEALGRVLHRLPAGAPLMHGSTIATNAVIERSGFAVGFVVTEGFRDLLTLQRQDREAIYDLDYRKPAPLVDERHIREVRERIAADGSVVTELDEESARVAADELVAAGVRAVAVCFLHSYRNPEHEQRVAEILKDAAPGLDVSLSSEVLPEFREYERATTTTIDAYLKSVVALYLDRLEQASPLGGPLWVMESNGGILPAEYARERPVVMLYSGPAAGVTGATRIARTAGVRNMITLDMGGTSTDVCLVVEGDPTITTDATLARLPIGIPMVDIQTVGAGGGSIAWIDSGGMLSVGPRSAGASPGPVCYARGGTMPTTTDAHVVRGLIRPEGFLGGNAVLDRDAAVSALESFGAPLGKSAAGIAEDILEIANSNIAHAVRIVSTERGYDAREFTLVAYGGAGPLHAASVADFLNLPEVLIPAFPGLISAYGLMAADVKRDFALTSVALLDELTPASVQRSFEALLDNALAEVAGHGISSDNVTVQYAIDMRYRGQGFELTVPVDVDQDLRESVSRLSARFHELHSSRYGHATIDEPVEVVTYRLALIQPTVKPSVPRVARDDSRELGSRAITLRGEQVDCAFTWRPTLASGQTIDGPAVIEEATSTTFVAPGWRCLVDEFMNLRLGRLG